MIGRLMSQLNRNGTAVQTLAAYVVRGFGAISLLWLYAVIAKCLSPEDAGYVLLGITVSTVLSGLSIVGLQMFSLRLIGSRSLEEDRSEIAYIASRTRWLAVPWSLVTACVVFLFADQLADNLFRKPLLAPALRWIAPSIFLSGMGLIYSHQLQGLRKFTGALITQSLGTQFFCAVILCFLETVTVTNASIAYSVASAINLALGLVFWRRTLPVVEATPIPFPDMASSCFSFWLVKAMIMAVNWAGLLIVGILVSDPAQIALFAVAQRVANVVNFLLIGVNVVVSPRFARFWRDQRLDRIRDLALKSTAAISLAAFPLVLLLTVFPRELLLLFKPEYAAAAPILVVLVLSQFFNVITGSVNQLLSMCEMEHQLRNIVVLSGVASIVLTLLLTSLYGVMGAAFACAISLFIQNLAAVYVVRRSLGFSMFDALRPWFWLSMASAK